MSDKLISLKRLPQMIEELRADKFFGAITIEFRAGQPFLMRQERTFKFEEGENPYVHGAVFNK